MVKRVRVPNKRKYCKIGTYQSKKIGESKHPAGICLQFEARHTRWASHLCSQFACRQCGGKSIIFPARWPQRVQMSRRRISQHPPPPELLPPSKSAHKKAPNGRPWRCTLALLFTFCLFHLIVLWIYQCAEREKHSPHTLASRPKNPLCSFTHMLHEMLRRCW